jgi:hypothetical protein
LLRNFRTLALASPLSARAKGAAAAAPINNLKKDRRMMKAEHIVSPYILDGLDITTPEDSGFAIIASVNPDTPDGGKSQGEFMVRACNSHYELLGALEGCLEALQSGMSDEERDRVFGDGYGIYQLMEEAGNVIAKARPDK